MARDFSARADIDNTNLTDFPDGRLLNSNPPSARNGTAVVEEVLGDILQLFLKLMRDASITPSGNADTDSVSQFLDALVAKIRATTASETEAGTVERATQQEVLDGTDAERFITTATLLGRTATTARSGVVRLADQAETDAGTAFSIAVTPLGLNTAAILNATSGAINLKTVNIGDWNMDGLLNVDVPHGLANFRNIIGVFGTIQNDVDDRHFPITPGQSPASQADVSISSIDATNIALFRRTGGVYDDPAFSSTTITTRGVLTILYTE